MMLCSFLPTFVRLPFLAMFIYRLLLSDNSILFFSACFSVTLPTVDDGREFHYIFCLEYRVGPKLFDIAVMSLILLAHG